MEFPCVTVSTGGSVGAAVNGDLATHMNELCAVFQVDNTQQLAYKTIVSEVMQNKLMWHAHEGDIGDPSVPVPVWWTTFVSDAVRSILLSGYFVYRGIGKRAGVCVCVVADPSEVWVKWDTNTHTYTPSCSKYRWRIGLVEAPLKHTASHSPIGHLSSAAIRAQVPTAALAEVVHNWMQRDRLNSVPAVFTKVSDELKQQNGSDRAWFRNVNSNDAMSTRAQDIDMNFHTLVHRRAETIQQLDAITNQARSRNGQTRTPVGATAFASPDDTEHAEHIVSDGRDFVERKSLASMADAKLQMDEMRHAVLFAFGVPPQALGKNINSERIASSNRLTEMALTTYTSFIKLLRSRIGAAIKTNTSTPNGGFVDFSCCLTNYEFENVQHFLVDSAIAPMISRTFDIPVGIIDTDKIIQARGEEHSGKRARTEVETAALKRAKATS